LTTGELAAVLEYLFKSFDVDCLAEITLEANPDDLDKAWLKQLAGTPVNRLSIGIQSFHDDDLQYLNRIHNGRQALASITGALEAGFSNLSIDLIYGIPGLDNEKWTANLRHALEYPVPHVSAYALTVEPGTALDLLIRKGKYLPVDELETIAHFEILLDMMEENDFEHYEISNFCQNGFYAKHNTSYWSGASYLGLGPSAHSYDGVSRQWNTADIKQYLQGAREGNIPFSKEILTLVQKFNEYVMTSLRTQWGCDLKAIRERFGETAAQDTLSMAGPYLKSGHLVRNADRLFLTRTGKLLADRISADLFRDD
jgi:oxygen-independent coproporphyrinogen-3 oxidase